MMEFFSFLLVLFASGALFWAALTDLKTREVPNIIPILLAVAGLLIHLIQSFLQNDYSILGVSIAVGVVTFGVAYALWRLGVWAGGDVKLFAAIGFTLPINPAPVAELLNVSFFSSISWPIFPLTLFIFSVFMGLPVALLKLFKAMLHQRELQQEMKKTIPRLALFSLILAFWSVSFSNWLNYFQLPVLLTIVLLVIVYRFSTRIQLGIGFLFWVVSALQFGVLNNVSLGMEWFLISFILGVLLESGSWAKQFVFTKKVLIKDLREGDISAVTLVEKNGKITEWKPTSLKAIFNNPTTAVLVPPVEAKVSAFKAAGLDQEELKWLKSTYLHQTDQKYLPVKESLAFVPLVWLSYVCLLVIGDLFWKIILP